VTTPSDNRNIGLGPNRDWSSHAADGFGLMCIHYDQPDGARLRRNDTAAGADRAAWLLAECLTASECRADHNDPQMGQQFCYKSLVVQSVLSA
jgi:hypothetical protein